MLFKTKWVKTFVITVLIKSVCVVAVYTILMMMLLSCWPGIK